MNSFYGNYLWFLCWWCDGKSYVVYYDGVYISVYVGVYYWVNGDGVDFMVLYFYYVFYCGYYGWYLVFFLLRGNFVKSKV